MTHKYGKNKYLKNSHILESVFRSVLREFCLDNTASETALRIGLQRKTINRLFMLFRKRIVFLTSEEDKLHGEIEVDESYFGARRVRGKRGRGAKGKIPVVGLLKRGGKVYTQIITNCTKEQLMPIIRGKVLSGSKVYTDGWASYDGLILYGYKHKRIHHHENEFARGKNHVNGIESFWSFTKRRLNKLNGIQKTYFLLHLKESEFRWNHKRDNIYKILLKDFRKNPL
jgi:transposase-like protein